MPQNIFNLYSASIFGDHPLSLWNLDDDFSFISLIGASPIWTITNGASSSAQLIKTKPGETVGVADSEIIVQSFNGSASSMILKTQLFNGKNDIDITKYTACISSFIYSDNDNISKIRIGFQYINPSTSVLTSVYTEYQNFVSETWLKVQHTQDIVDEIDGSTGNGINFYPYIEVIYKNNPTNRLISLYNFSVGQWSEEYNSETTGAVPLYLNQISASNIFQNIIGGIYSSSPQNIKLVPIDTYSIDDTDNGYYLIENNKMLSTNTKLPMVFGSGNITEIYHSNYGNPSIIFPGKGFLHSLGKYKELTLEFWLKINPDIGTDFKILGQLASDDGLYVRNGFLKLKIGPYEKSYFVGKWYRPMLINITYSQNSISLMINGEKVIEILLNPINITFPSNLLYNTDWLAFYSHEFITKFEIDCIAIYPYIVSEQVAKKKFVLAQGVGKSDEIVNRFGGSLTNIDFSFANYSNTVSYPSTVNWNSGIYSNIDLNSKFLSLPVYEKPSINYIGEDLSIFSTTRFSRSWGGVAKSLWSLWKQSLWKAISLARESEPLYDNSFGQTDSELIKHITFRPTTLYNNVYGSLNFKSLNIIKDPVASIFAMFSITQTELSNAISDNNINELTLIHFRNSATGDIFKIYIDPNTSQIIYKFNSTIIGTPIPLTINTLETKFIVGIDIEKVFKSYSQIIRNFFLNPQNILLSVGGYEKNMFTGKIYKVTFNNKFFNLKDLSNIFQDDGLVDFASANSELSNGFEEYIGNYTLLFRKTNDSMIMDIGVTGYWEDSIPLSSLGTFTKDADGTTTKYTLDMMQFNIDCPSPPYSSQSVSVNSKINIDSFATIKRYDDISLINYIDYTNTKELTSERVVDFEESNINVDNTKFRIIDNSIIFAPKTLVDFNESYITIHLEIKSDGVLTDPINLNRMSLSSLAYDEISLYELGSPNGNKLYPFVRSSYSYSNKIKNPFIFYKDSMPYLYLTDDSGVFSLPYNAVDSSATLVRGITMPINLKKDSTFSLHGIQCWIAFNKNYEFDSQIKIMSIILKNTDRINFYLIPTDNKRRAKIVAKLSTITGETDYTNIKFYQNGILLENQYLKPLSWSMLTFSFNTPLDYSNFIGQTEIYPGIILNNFGIYQSSIENKVDDIFESHLGLSNIVAQDESQLYINSDDVDLYTGFQWSFFSGKPV